MAKLMTDEHLAELVRPDEDRALQALAQGNLPAVRAALERMAAGHAGLDALTVHALARKAGKLRQDFGEERAKEALRRIGAQLMRTWIEQFRAGAPGPAIADLIAVFKHQFGAQPQPLQESGDAVTLTLAPCGSGGRLERAGLPSKHPAAYGGWSDGVSSLCQACKANQAALNEALGAPVWTSEKLPDGHCRLRFAKSGCAGQQLFNENERRSLMQTRVQLAAERLAAGNSDIGPLLKGQRKDWMPWHDFAIVWLEYFYATALELGGADYLDQMLAQTYEPAFHAGFPRYAAMSDEELVAEIARTWNYHMADFTVTEEERRFVFRLDPCGSGGRLFRGQVWRDMFHYGQALAPLMDTPHAINFGRARAPTYCTHCAASNRAQLASARTAGTPLFFIIDGRAQAQPGMPCRQFSYKKGTPPAAVDPGLFTQIGLPAPHAAETDTEQPR